MAQIAPASKSADLDAEPSALAGLLARVEAAAGPDQRKTMVAVFEALVPLIERHPDGYVAQAKFFGLLDAGGFTDAALALCERVLPGWIVMNLAEWEDDRLRARGSWMAQLKQRGVLLTKPNEASCMSAPTPALALLCAMLKALVAQAESRQP